MVDRYLHCGDLCSDTRNFPDVVFVLGNCDYDFDMLLKELEQLEKDLEALAAEKDELESALGSGSLPYDQLQAASQRIGEILALTDEKEFRLLELYELQ